MTLALKLASSVFIAAALRSNSFLCFVDNESAEIFRKFLHKFLVGDKDLIGEHMSRLRYIFLYFVELTVVDHRIGVFLRVLPFPAEAPCRVRPSSSASGLLRAL